MIEITDWTLPSEIAPKTAILNPTATSIYRKVKKVLKRKKTAMYIHQRGEVLSERIDFQGLVEHYGVSPDEEVDSKLSVLCYYYKDFVVSAFWSTGRLIFDGKALGYEYSREDNSSNAKPLVIIGVEKKERFFSQENQPFVWSDKFSNEFFVNAFHQRHLCEDKFVDFIGIAISSIFTQFESYEEDRIKGFNILRKIKKSGLFEEGEVITPSDFIRYLELHPIEAGKIPDHREAMDTIVMAQATWEELCGRMKVELEPMLTRVYLALDKMSELTADGTTLPPNHPLMRLQQSVFADDFYEILERC